MHHQISSSLIAVGSRDRSSVARDDRGAGHGFDGDVDTAGIVARSVDYLRRALYPPSSDPDRRPPRRRSNPQSNDWTRRMTIPHLRRSGSRVQLIVDDRPYLALGGELYNSTSSDPRCFRPVFAELATAGVGTVIATVSWEHIEPVEGSFDFTVLDELLATARVNSIRLVLISFGVQERRVHLCSALGARRPTSVSPRGSSVPGNAGASRTKARPRNRCSLCSHRNCGAPTAQPIAPCSRTCGTTTPSTLLCSCQVENEIGLLGDSRDRRIPRTVRGIATCHLRSPRPPGQGFDAR